MFDLNHISHFLAIIRHGHFGRAAKEIHISQSALSRSIQTLEKKLGKQLLIRERSRIRLTKDGEIVALHGERLLRERQALLTELNRQTKADEGEIRIGLGVFPAEQSGVSAASCLIGASGNLLCQLRVADYRQTTEDILAQRIDLGFCDLAAAREDERIQCLPLHHVPFFCYTRPDHPLQHLRNPSAKDIFNYPLVGVRKPKRINIDGNIGYHLDELTGEWLPVLNAVSPNLTLKLIEVCDAVAFAPLPMIASFLEEGRVGLVPTRVPNLHLDLGFIHLVDRPPNDLACRYMAEVSRLEKDLMARGRALETKFGVGPRKSRSTNTKA